MWPVETLKAVTKRIQTARWTMAMAKRKEEIIDMVETMTIFFFVSF